MGGRWHGRQASGRTYASRAPDLGGFIIIRMRVLEFTPNGPRVRVAFSWQTNAGRILALSETAVA